MTRLNGYYSQLCFITHQDYAWLIDQELGHSMQLQHYLPSADLLEIELEAEGKRGREREGGRVSKRDIHWNTI